MAEELFSGDLRMLAESTQENSLDGLLINKIINWFYKHNSNSLNINYVSLQADKLELINAFTDHLLEISDLCIHFNYFFLILILILYNFFSTSLFLHFIPFVWNFYFLSKIRSYWFFLFLFNLKIDSCFFFKLRSVFLIVFI